MVGETQGRKPIQISIFVVVKQIVNNLPESRSGGDRGDNQIGDFVRDGGQNPSLEESIKLEPFIIVFRERDDGAVDVALEIESADQEEKEATPLLVVRLREAEKNRNMEFDVGDRRESKMRRLGRGDVGVGGDLAVGHWGEESRRREEERRREVAAGDERERRRCCRWNCREGEPRGRPGPALTMEDVMRAINNLGKELETTKSYLAKELDVTKSHVAELLAAGNPPPHDDLRRPPPYRPPSAAWRPPASRTSQFPAATDPIPRMRIDAPRFSSEDPVGWIFRIQKYFDYFLTPEAERLHLVAVLIDHPASEWFRYYQANNCNVSWMAFLVAVRQRFDPDYYENYIGLLSKLHQTTTVMDYQSSFEALLNKVASVPEPTLIAMYIAGLKQPVQREVNLRAPGTLQETFALAREYAASRQDAQAAFGSSARRQWGSPRPNPSTSGQPSGISTPAHTNPPKPPDTRAVNSLPVVRLTNAEKAERGKKGLCWFCEEKLDPTHHCKRRFLALMGPDDEDMAAGEEPNEHPITEDLIITGDISSLHSLAGSPSPCSLRLTGNIKNSPVHVLLDGGSTHNFIHPTVAERLSLVLYPVTPFRVYVGNGESLRCSYSCPQTAVALQGHIFAIDLYLLEIHGPEVVLGVQWLQTLGKVSHDYANLTMEFTWNGVTVQLRGDAPGPKPISYGHLCTLVATKQPLEFYELVPAPTDTLPASAAPAFPSDAADALSRRDSDDNTAASFVALSQPMPVIMEAIRAEQRTNPELVALKTAAEAGTATPELTVQDGVLYYNRRIYLSAGSNLSRHEGLKVSPFQALYGREPPHVFATPSVRSKVPAIEEILLERAAVLEELKANLWRVQQRMRASANMHRRDVSFQVGELVLLKLQPYRQHSVAKPKSAKLARRYYGPFEVVERVGQVAYRLRLPDGCRIHDVFHVSLLRPFVTPATGVPTPTWPEEFVQNHPLSVPVAALRSRTILVDGDPQEQWLIRWSDGTADDSTWEPVHMLREHFPTLRLEDKANSDSGGVDTGLEHATHNEDEEPEEPESPRVRCSRRIVGPPQRYKDYMCP
ncbi:unnamed protein product [Cuscuta campestris]|uniref:Ty3 transposon capsid-like protein domain-containing protein n=1 Tax=Cuscuta campestris TaxID=132261 RepID=A0A484LXR9_9ASTE|nr:unnamed protein product [Cuscuta campestris]